MSKKPRFLASDETEREEDPLFFLWLLASRPALGGGPSFHSGSGRAGRCARGEARGGGATTSGTQSTRQRHPFAITIRGAPLGRGEGERGEIFMRGAFTHTDTHARTLIYRRLDSGTEPRVVHLLLVLGPTNQTPPSPPEPHRVVFFRRRKRDGERGTACKSAAL